VPSAAGDVQNTRRAVVATVGEDPRPDDEARFEVRLAIADEAARRAGLGLSCEDLPAEHSLTRDECGRLYTFEGHALVAGESDRSYRRGGADCGDLPSAAEEPPTATLPTPPEPGPIGDAGGAGTAELGWRVERAVGDRGLIAVVADGVVPIDMVESGWACRVQPATAVASSVRRILSCSRGTETVAVRLTCELPRGPAAVDLILRAEGEADVVIRFFCAPDTVGIAARSAEP
jgi:hypothetical protein